MSAGASAMQVLKMNPFVAVPARTILFFPISNRLLIALFVALGLHGFVLFGTGFKLSLNPATSHSIEVTLATHRARKAPKDADFLAQYHQDGSGSEEQANAITAETTAEFESNTINEISEEQLRQSSTQVHQKNTVNSTHWSDDQSRSQTRYQQFQDTSTGDSAKDLQMSQEVASLKAKLDKQRQAYAKRPRVRRLTSVSTQASDDAQYLLNWSQQVEVVGNRNYPQQALSRGIHGELRLLAVIDVKGALVKAEVLKSSGYHLLDDAALNIVHKAAPYAPFPPSIRKNTDHIEIIRTWRFQISGFSTK